jgi:hypothetical protein
MRRMLIAALIAGLSIAATAQAQPYGFHPSPWTADYAYRYDPPRAYGYDGRYTPYSYGNGYDGYNGYNGHDGGDASAAAGLGGMLLGAAMTPDVLDRAPHDRFGPDPNGMAGPDGRPIKCKLTNRYDSYYGRYMTRRECW